MSNNSVTLAMHNAQQKKVQLAKSNNSDWFVNLVSDRSHYFAIPVEWLSWTHKMFFGTSLNLLGWIVFADTDERHLLPNSFDSMYGRERLVEEQRRDLNQFVTTSRRTSQRCIAHTASWLMHISQRNPARHMSVGIPVPALPFSSWLLYVRPRAHRW